MKKRQPGTLHLEVQARGVGRIKVRSGTKRKATLKAMRDMCRTLYQMGRADILRDIKAGRVSVMDVYERYRTGKIDQLPTGDVMKAALAVFEDWLAGKVLADTTRKDYREARDRVLAFGTDGAPLSALPKMLEAHRRASIGVHQRSFDQDLAAWLSCLNRVLGKSHWLTYECARVEKLHVPDEKKMAYNPQTVGQVREWAGKFGEKGLPHHALTMWGIALTGMRPEEFFEQRGNAWELEATFVRVNGTKTKAAKRLVPRLGLIVKSSTTRETFTKALRQLTDGTVTPYDLRRSFSQWMDDAHIPEYRQRFYFGHGPKDVTQLYKRMRDCMPHIEADTAALSALVTEPIGLKVVK